MQNTEKRLRSAERGLHGLFTPPVEQLPTERKIIDYRQFKRHIFTWRLKT
nr:MAG TPA: hypothetical protein [Caudoviricetes sp.]